MARGDTGILGDVNTTGATEVRDPVADFGYDALGAHLAEYHAVSPGQ